MLENALHHAPDRTVAAAARPEQEIFSFRLAGLRLAFGATGVREIIRIAPITPLPRTPAYVMGVCGHRGEVLPVVDILRFLQKGEVQLTSRSRLVVGTANNFVAAFAADQVEGLSTLALSDILPAPLGGDTAAEHVDGIVGTGDALMHLLNLPRLLQSVRQRVVTR